MDEDPRSHLAEVGRQFYDRGWMWATAGNLSARADPESFWITGSGVSKGSLTAEQFVRLKIADGAILECADPAARPSAEASIHRAIYRVRGSSVGACLHGHSVAAVLAARLGDHLALPRVEMIKALGVWDDDAETTLPIFPNHAQVARIGDLAEGFLQANPDALPALIVRDHGVTAWGRTIPEAVQHFEAVEFLLTLLSRGF